MYFYIKTPDGTVTITFDKNTTFEEKLEILNKKVFEPYKDFLMEYKHTTQAKKMLLDCTNFLIMGRNNKTTLTPRKLKRINEKELPLTYVKNKFIEEYLYGSPSEDYDDYYVFDSETEYVEQDISKELLEDYCNLRVKEINRIEDSRKQKGNDDKKSWENSKTYKINQLYSSTDKCEEVTDDRVSVYYISKDKLVEYINDESLKFKGNIKTKKVLVHKGRKGAIDKNKPYIAEWKQVNIDNEFEFNKNKYKISNKLKQYQLDLDNHKYIMDSVLCYYIPHEDKYYFFDENIDEITKYVKQV